MFWMCVVPRISRIKARICSAFICENPRQSKMQEVTRKRAIAVGLRARVPVITRLVAFALLMSGIALVGISYYKLRNVEKFKAKSEKPELSKEVTGRVEGYEQRVTKNDRLYLLV